MLYENTYRQDNYGSIKQIAANTITASPNNAVHNNTSNASRGTTSDDDTINEYDCGSITDSKNTAFTELVEIIRTSIPLSITFLLQFFITTITMITVGRIGTVELGAVSIANVTFQVSVCIFIGLATCLDTLCPQAYGLGKKKLVLIYFLKCCLISLMAGLPIITLWWFSSSFLKLIIDDLKVIEFASLYLRIMILSVPGYIIFECGKKFLQSQHDFVAGQKILFAAVPFDIALNFILVTKMGFIGAPIAVVLTYSLMGILIFIKISQTECWTLKSQLNWNSILQGDWSTLISLAVPGIIMLEAEFFAFEILTVLASKFGTTILAAQSIAASLQALLFQIPFSFSVAASNRIAFHIGREDLDSCKIASKVTLLKIGPGLCLINFSIFILGRNHLSKLFTSDPQVIEDCSKLLVLIGINQLYDIFNVLSAGCLRAQGRQKIGGYLNIFCYYVIGLPLGIFLGFKTNLKVLGFWIGLGVGIMSLALAELYFVIKCNWVGIIEKSQKLHSSGHANVIRDLV
ncbi:uncharacterized protein SCODWIG_01323 [Saccharomycodes ludwigii]|uniref:Ethionine resistance-conferring protein 1 n=1 Tax=Saccharomycodes ludwigii TaxID=36035 RepID=A0A376B4L7_9ASCO|nr:hypothetical protein SCDLUD_003686 [Saccharomycodes ludwigii]KAH3900687.1 hypothetical protein SCDLUD_003686 [Saccharomycodes ludwigii]SSD59562.1 uncharacterized protein SCODWIG_01323 [Saccharomycodes ludwigii]